MLNPFQKNKIKIITSTSKFERVEVKPNIIRTFEKLYPGSPLKRSARAMLSLCPFHGESHPSFAMYEETNTYFCFSCEAKGDSFNLIKHANTCDFKDAIEFAKQNNLYD